MNVESARAAVTHAEHELVTANRLVTRARTAEAKAEAEYARTVVTTRAAVSHRDHIASVLAERERVLRELVIEANGGHHP